MSLVERTKKRWNSEAKNSRKWYDLDVNEKLEEIEKQKDYEREQRENEG